LVLEVVVQLSDRVYVATLALRRVRAEPDSCVDGLPALPQQGDRSIPGRRRIGPPAERNPPVGHRAGGVGGEHVIERADRCAELERVKQRDGAIETRRDRWATRSR